MVRLGLDRRRGEVRPRRRSVPYGLLLLVEPDRLELFGHGVAPSILGGASPPRGAGGSLLCYCLFIHVNTSTLFRIGSVTKLFTWTAVMQLAEQGKLDLKADVNTYLKAFKIPVTFPGETDSTRVG